MNRTKSKWKINHEIRAPQVRALGADGSQIGVMTLSEALKKAQDNQEDVVEIAPQANPPVVKIIEFGKFRYEQEKKERENRKKAKSSELKEVRFSPFIGDHDFMTRIKQVNRFLKDNNKVKLVIVFKGRQMNSKKFGYELLDKITDTIDYTYTVDMEPKFIGRHLAMIVSPLKKVKKENGEETKDQKVTDKES